MSAAALDAPITADELAQSLYTLLVDLDPALFHLEAAEAAEAARAALATIRAKAEALVATYQRTPPTEADAKLWDAVRALYAGLPDPRGLTDPDAFAAFYAAVWPLYEQLVDALTDEGEHANHLRPTNTLRMIVHISLGLGIALAFETVLTPHSAFLLALAWCAWAWTVEISRRLSPTVNDGCMWFFGPIARKQESKHVNSSTWFGTGILISAALLPPVPAVLGLIAAAVGDPSAAFFGRRFGRTKLYLGRSLEGSLAFAVVAFLVGSAWVLAFHPAVGIGHTLLLAGSAAVVGAVAEHLSDRVDDNLAVTVLAGAAAAVMAFFTR